MPTKKKVQDVNIEDVINLAKKALDTPQASEQQIPEEVPSGPMIDINDFTACRDIIKAAIERGAFRANEISKVGAVFDKLDSFVNGVVDAINKNNPNANLEPPKPQI